MFDAALWVDYNQTCGPVKNHSKCTDNEIWFNVPILSFSLLALILNTICTIVFVRQKRRSIMRLSLLLLSTSEVLFHTFVAMDYLIRLSVCSENTHQVSALQRILVAFINLGADSTLCCRNWCNVLITAARTEVVVSPIRSKRLFTRKSIIAMYFFILTLSILLSLVRCFYDYIVLCVPTGEPIKWWDALLQNPHVILPLLSNFVISNYEAYCFFIHQVILPVLLVLTMSMTIAFYMSPWKKSEILEVSMVRRRHQMHATRTILILATTFLCFEMPSFILVLLQHFTRLVSSEHSRFRYRIAQFAADLFLISDSIANILIYSFKLPEFRRHLAWFLCISQRECDNADYENEYSRTNVSVIRIAGSLKKFNHQSSPIMSPARDECHDRQRSQTRSVQKPTETMNMNQCSMGNNSKNSS